MDDNRNRYSLDFVQSMITNEAGRFSGWYKNLALATLYQPVFSLPHRRAIGVEAILRATDSTGQQAASGGLFADVTNFSETLLLDRLCIAVHLQNFFAAHRALDWIFVNMQPGVFLEGNPDDTFLTDLFAKCGAAKNKVVLEVPGSALADPQRARAAVGYYRDLGCLIAIDDFGAENSNLDAVWHIQPTFVKIDRSILVRAREDQAVKQMMPRVVSVLHQMGSFVVMEGVENMIEAMIAVDSDVDFASGYYFAAPGEDASNVGESDSKLQRLWTTFKEQDKLKAEAQTTERVPLLDGILYSSFVDRLRKVSAPEISKYREERRPYLLALQHAVSRFEDGVAFERACKEFLDLDGAIRCFMLNAEGRQVGLDVYSANPPDTRQMDFVMPLESQDSDWSRKDYYRRAVKEPGVVQVTRPYRSFTGYGFCVTVSLTAKTDGKLQVICGDIDWSTHSHISSLT
ncbi:MAG: EAL domain-containing protein [Burkholderiales bacterium]